MPDPKDVIINITPDMLEFDANGALKIKGLSQEQLEALKEGVKVKDIDPMARPTYVVKSIIA